MQIPSIAKEIDYNPQGMIFAICDIVKEVQDQLGNITYRTIDITSSIMEHHLT
jgi:hypothetical protein